ncbi:MAG TPA: hypothetical protein PL072_07855 [Phycisphaerales bacterium]|nr:hypothetical protein [Phycisphaerales bacterium]
MHIHRVQVRRVARAPGDAPASAWQQWLSDPAFWSVEQDADGRGRAGARALKVELDASGAAESWVIRRALPPGEKETNSPVGAGAREVVVKARRLTSSFAALKEALGFGRADRHWRSAAALAVGRVGVARPLCLARAWTDAGRVELLALEALDGPTLLEALAEIHRWERTPGSAPDGPLARGLGDVRAQHRLVDAVVDQVLALPAAWLFNRDHKPSNLIVTRAGPMGARVAMIDCVGVRPAWRPGDERLVERMLFSLVVEPRGCGVLPRRALLMRGAWRVAERWASGERASAGDGPVQSRAPVRREARALWRAVGARLAAHGEGRPRVDPLSGRARS